MIDAAPTIFIVDDEECVRKSPCRLLRSAGYQNASFCSLGEFLDACRPCVPGCPVLDMAMPGMSGLELQQTLATWETAWPIIFLTGQDDARSPLNASERGTTEFFTKPVEARLLLAAVARAIKKDRIDRLGPVSLVQVHSRV